MKTQRYRIQEAIEAHLEESGMVTAPGKLVERLEEAIREAVLEEREACAKVVDGWLGWSGWGDPAIGIAAAIRGRGK